VITSEPGRQVGTVGKLAVFPNTPNVVPGKVECTLEVRDLEAKKIDALFVKIEAEAKKIGAMNGTSFAFKQVLDNVPAPTAPEIRAVIAAAATELGLSHKTMPSGAGHDAQDVAQIGPVGMIFVPSKGGISHAPNEYSTPQDITNGANVLMNALLKLDAAL
jgi:beta-ureidopropionase / N-carbamoyl-L-amino-acid hydrolase